MATLPSPPADLTPEQLYLGHLKRIDQIAVHAARRHHFSREEAEDFVSTVRFKLFEDDYRIIRKFEGKSTFSTYLTTVIQRQMLDYQNHVWGKWRVSEKAKRLGPAAVRLEVLLVREGLTFDEACEYLRTNEHVELSHDELDKIAELLPHRNPPRWMEGDEELAKQAAEVETPEELLLGREAAERGRRVRHLLRQAQASLSPVDRLLVTMSTEFQVSEIAKALHLEQKPLYRRLDKIRQALRDHLEKAGIRSRDILELLSALEKDFGGDS